MFKDRYFFKGTLLGLVCIVLVAVKLLGVGLFSVFIPLEGKLIVLSVLMGAFVMTAIARSIDRHQPKIVRGFIGPAIALPFFIFFMGDLTGSFVNFLTSFSVLNSASDFSTEAGNSWVTPFFLFMMYGGPLSILIGIGYFLFQYLNFRIKSKRQQLATNQF